MSVVTPTRDCGTHFVAQPHSAGGVIEFKAMRTRAHEYTSQLQLERVLNDRHCRIDFNCGAGPPNSTAWHRTMRSRYMLWDGAIREKKERGRILVFKGREKSTVLAFVKHSSLEAGVLSDYNTKHLQGLSEKNFRHYCRSCKTAAWALRGGTLAATARQQSRGKGGKAEIKRMQRKPWPRRICRREKKHCEWQRNWVE